MFSRISLVAAIGLLSASVASSAMITLNANRDTQLRGGWAKATNYGAAPDIYATGVATDTSENYTVLIGFDLTSVEGDVNSATLQIYKSNGSTSAVSFTAYKGTQNDWVESQVSAQYRKTGVAWTTLGGEYDLLSSATSSATTAGAVWLTLDVTSIVQSMKDSGWNYGSFFVKSTAAGASFSEGRTAAKEGTMWTPTNPTAPTDKFAKLTVDSVAIPEPATISLIALGTLALARRRRNAV